MNILFTSDLSGMGGGETSLVNFCEFLKNSDNVSVLCNCNGTLVNILKEKRIKTYVVNYRDKIKVIKNFLIIRKIIKKEKIEIIHNNDPLTSILMFIISFGLNVSNYWTCHGQWYNFSLLKKILVKISNKHIFCVSSKVRDSLYNMGFKNISVTYLGIDIKKYENAKPSTILTEYNIDTKAMVLASIGRYQRIKGQLKLVKALKKLIEEKDNVVCLLIGGCIYNNKEEELYYNEIENYIMKNSLEKNIIMTGERGDIPNIMKQIDLLVIPSDNESFGMVAIEALAAELPVISTPNDGVSEILDYKKEFIAETNDVNGLYKIIKKYIKSSDSQKEAQLFAKERKMLYDIQKVSNRYLKVFYSKGVK